MTSTYEDSWALVVGIDAYDDPGIKDLSGAVMDACDSVNWLRRAGVPDDHILLHAQPTDASRPLLESLGAGVPWHPATTTDITRSIAMLRTLSGSHLFVFLLGHGIYEPSTKRLFVTSEASLAEHDVLYNLGIEEHIELFLSMRFPEQLLVMDGCQNLPYSESRRSRIPAGMPFAGFNARRGNALVFCFACQQGERAVEIEGRGLFLKNLLSVIDTQNPLRDILHLNFDNGDISIDLRKAVTEIVGPRVTKVAWNQRPRVRQEPGVQPYGAGTAWSVWPLHLPPTPVARISVAVKPASAAKDVRAILVQVEDPPYWRREAPVSPTRTVDLPFENRLPHETSLSVICQLKSNSDRIRPAERRLRIGDRDSKVTFNLRRSPRADRRAASAGGGPVGGRLGPLETVRHKAYRSARKARGDDPASVFVGCVDSNGHAVSSTLRGIGQSIQEYAPTPPAGIEVTRREGGLTISGRHDNRELLMQFASNIANAFAADTPDEISTIIRESPIFPQTAVRIALPEGGPEQLVGPLTDTPVITVGEKRRTVREIEAESLVNVQPGYVDVRVDLPWGSWSDTVEVFEGIEKNVQLPPGVGSGFIPLRVAMPAHLWEEFPGYSVIGPAPLPQEAIIQGDTQLEASARPLYGTEKWLLTVDAKESTWGTYVSLPGTGVTFPLHPSLPLALDISEGAAWVEPLSTTPAPEWDDLVSLGHLGGHNPKSLLKADKAWAPDAVLTTARAYACYAAGADTYTRSLLRLLRDRGIDIPDIAVLEGATALRSKDSVPKSVRSALTHWADAGTVPVMRWGIAPAVVLAQTIGLDVWCSRLEAIEESLSPVSIWAVWRTP
ncbi:hypothetical protein [Streptomyces sp. SP2-10]|uniref:hypothetical protein n=1 Tax=Streptomyces sp. SP2-10 TaxID=2873385 RepID=UPI001CA65BEA|nr:hypothetical protein [Streptomyces sp. SP2-10]MBY8847138.1 hypothetical protein [Streptomyces sp. SP2-10]